MNQVILYCRSGFEKECSAEILDRAAKYKILGSTYAERYSGYVIFKCYQLYDADKLIKKISFHSLIFSRQIFVGKELSQDLLTKDRITPILTIFRELIDKGGDLRVEIADTNEGKKLIKFCRKFSVPLRTKLRNENILTNCRMLELPVLHVFFVSLNLCYVGYSLAGNNSPFYMGIPRLRFPPDAPSRSTLKLEEAFHFFIPKDEWDVRLASGMYAVDLGACPGGWTYQLVKRNMYVYSVDNGQISRNLLNTGKVIWLHENGFRFRPNHNNISWLVCDISEKPIRVSARIVQWIINAWCREAIFNLKLPMKKRYEEVLKNLSYIQNMLCKNNINAIIQARQLYHDREEITVHIRRVDKF